MILMDGGLCDGGCTQRSEPDTGNKEYFSDSNAFLRWNDSLSPLWNIAHQRVEKHNYLVRFYESTSIIIYFTIIFKMI